MSKRLIDISDEDVIAVVNRIHILTRNSIVSRNGILDLSFEESYRKYGCCYIDILIESIDTITDGCWSSESKFRLNFNHKNIWFEEFDSYGKPSNYNKNHFYGYLKLVELGYEIPDKPSI